MTDEQFKAIIRELRIVQIILAIMGGDPDFHRRLVTAMKRALPSKHILPTAV